jgi:hypothetical protein
MPGRIGEGSGTNENPWKPRTDLYKPTISSLGPTGHINPFQGVKIISLLSSDRLPEYRRPHTLQARGTRIFLVSLTELLELSAHHHCNHYSYSISNHWT